MFFDNMGQAPVSSSEWKPLIRACASIICLKWLFSEIGPTACKKHATPLEIGSLIAMLDLTLYDRQTIAFKVEAASYDRLTSCQSRS